MAPTKVKFRAKSSQSLEKPRPTNEGNERNHNDLPEKDETEEQLEKLIFGDEAGFLSGLQAPTARKDLVLRSDSDEEVSGEEGDLEDVPDDQLSSWTRAQAMPRKELLAMVNSREDTISLHGLTATTNA